MKQTIPIQIYGSKMAIKDRQAVIQQIANRLNVTRDTLDGCFHFREIADQVDKQYDLNQRKISFKIVLSCKCN